MKKTFLIVLFAFSILSSFGQTKSDSIQVIHKLGTVFQQNGKNLTPSQLSQIIQTNKEASAEMKIAKTNYNASLVFQIPGGFLIGYPIGTALAGGKPNWTLAAIGAGLVVVAIPLVSAYNKHAKNAVGIYNKGLKYSSLIQLNIKLGVTSNGLGFRVNF
jgi:uncharacterized membrane protein YedE/YeeE